MTQGYQIEPSVSKGKTVWLVIRLSDRKIIAKEKTVGEAARRLEEAIEDA